MKKILLLLLTLISINTVAPAQLNYIYNKRLNEVFDSVCNLYNIKGASAAIVVPNEGTWERGYGISHGTVNITPSMYLGMGSNSKTYFAVLMLKLQEQNKLSLDDTIGKWVTNQPNIPGNITIRQLLNHTSGLYSFTSNSKMNDYILNDYTRIWPIDSVFNLVEPPKATPGGPWDYSNTNYTVAGVIIEAVTGKTAYKALRDEILMPHGLSETYCFPQETPTGTIPHSWSNLLNTSNSMEDLIAVHNYSHNAMFSLAYTAGALMCTAKDNALFWDKLMSGQILNSSSMTEFETFVPISTGQGYGLGVFKLDNFNGRPIVSHGGTNVGFINDNIHDKTSGVTITILTNQDSVSNSILLDQCIRALHKVTIRYTDINNVSLGEDISVYPIPAKNELFITTPTQNAKILLYNINGRVSATQQLQKGKNTINVSDLPTGTYFININNKNETIHRQTIQIVH